MKLWAGRFGSDLHGDAEAYMQSVDVDGEMVLEDIWGSEAHSIMLGRRGIISGKDLRVILKWLGKAKKDYVSGRFRLNPGLEDVHMNVESYIIKNAGMGYGGKLQTARSRNDQVVTDSRLYVRERILDCMESLAGLQTTLLDISKKNVDTVIPGYTHTQHAQPITLAYWLTAFVSSFNRDLRRLRNSYEVVNSNTLGSCALAGTSFRTDRRLTTKLLGFDGVSEHALDSVSSRDFMLESVASLAILMSDISRLASDIVYWSSSEFRFIEVDDSFTSGSSIMPQKKNPCVAELARAKTASVYGALVQLLTVMKGIPMGYNRDLQEDKPMAFSAFKTVNSTIEVMNGMLKTVKFDKCRMYEMAYADFTTATELANYLVREKGLSFRESHKAVGSLVKRLINDGKDFCDLEDVVRILNRQGISVPERTLQRVLDPQNIVVSYDSLGGTSPREVSRMIKSFEKETEKYRNFAKMKRRRINESRKLTEKIVKGVLRGADVGRMGV